MWLGIDHGGGGWPGEVICRWRTSPQAARSEHVVTGQGTSMADAVWSIGGSNVTDAELLNGGFSTACARLRS